MVRLLITALGISPFLLFSQSKNIELVGKVILKSSKNPIEYASVMAKSRTDSTLNILTATDSTGNFKIKNVSAGIWQIKCSFIGYEIKDTTITIQSDAKKFI